MCSACRGLKLLANHLLLATGPVTVSFEYNGCGPSMVVGQGTSSFEMRLAECSVGVCSALRVLCLLCEMRGLGVSY